MLLVLTFAVAKRKGCQIVETDRLATHLHEMARFGRQTGQRDAQKGSGVPLRRDGH